MATWWATQFILNIRVLAREAQGYFIMFKKPKATRLRRTVEISTTGCLVHLEGRFKLPFLLVQLKPARTCSLEFGSTCVSISKSLCTSDDVVLSKSCLLRTLQ
ncbi:hypothetical protein NDU88_008481 [Pleurodeles waltl]|uniref:Secreted protein n=1 Tax=Pleurodeles waltl TaxID=8319 RepID=A0AAV7PPW4_PLEWA|nr:hypothetical protein NDU88_008481 [Pleurodeles waltl]